MPIAAIVGKKNTDVSRQITNMLEAMSHNKRFFFVATDKDAVTANNIRSIDIAESKNAIGRCSYSINDQIAAANQNNELFLALEGYITCSRLSPCYEGKLNGEVVVNSIADRIRKNKSLFEALRSILTMLHGGFSMTILCNKAVAIARDVFGFQPLYWGENEKYIAFASERKALWSIGFSQSICFPPGHVATIDGKTLKMTRVLSLVRPQTVDFDLVTASKKLIKTLNKVFLTDFKKIGELGLLFSGGLDSSFIAKLSCNAGKRVTLYGAAVEGAHDVDVIKSSASKLGYKPRLRIIPQEEVEEYVYKTIYAVEEPDVMKIGVGIPIYAALESATADDIECVFSGQGADELFGGYSRYRGIICNGYNRLYDEMWNDVVKMAKVNLQRDNNIAIVNNVNCFFPFLNWEVVNLAMSFPANLKVKGPNDMLRKHVLREAAKMLGLPETIAHMPKKAAQYSSGAHREIKKLARCRGKHPSEYIRHIFKSVFKKKHPQIFE